MIVIADIPDLVGLYLGAFVLGYTSSFLLRSFRRLLYSMR